MGQDMDHVSLVCCSSRRRSHEHVKRRSSAIELAVSRGSRAPPELAGLSVIDRGGEGRRAAQLIDDRYGGWAGGCGFANANEQ
ncbi:MAG: hypothetical protein CL928_13055 [Deltaproteobacteria bacterium]|nr:hypothetical protein [Deltaproteobacteria bacterium]